VEIKAISVNPVDYKVATVPAEMMMLGEVIGLGQEKLDRKYEP
jgi:hypothetical protein